MSIIHDALKKVQRGLTPQEDKPQATPSTNTSPYVDPPSAVETLFPSGKIASSNSKKPPVKNKIKSVVALCCALAITVTSIFYIWKQIENKSPQVQIFIRKSLDRFFHKKPGDFKTNSPENLVPLAQITVTPPSPKPINPPSPAESAAPVTPTAAVDTPKPIAPVTLNVHGVMSNGSSNIALINDQVYQEGDEVDGVKIVKIDLNAITIINNGKEETISVKQ